MRHTILFIAAFSLIIFSSCDPDMVYDQFEKTQNQEWAWEDVKRFELEINDSLNFFNVYTNIRHTKAYPKSNLYLFVTIKGPRDNEIRDTIDVQIANKHGKWLGSGFGEIKFVRKKIKNAVRFAHTGTYIIEVEQGMRLPAIPVTDVGIRIEKFNQ